MPRFRRLLASGGALGFALLLLAAAGCHGDLKETDPFQVDHDEDQEYFEMHYPTGLRATSVISLRYLGPEWVNAGQDYDARLVAENLSELTL